MSDINKKIGLKVKGLRKSHGLSQIELAEKINLSFQQVQKYEKGITAISVFRLQQIAEAFGVPISNFFEEEKQSLKVSGPTLEYDPGKTHPKTLQILTQEEISLLKSFRKLGNKKLRQGVLRQLQGLIDLEREK
jgi:transcriptional regulator with XRE-family HTH domain